MAGLNDLFGSLQFAQFIHYGNLAIWVVGFSIALGVLGFFALKFFRFKHPVIIFEVVGDAIQITKDKAALVKDKETQKAFQFKLLKEKALLPPPPADAYVFTKRGKKAIMIGKVSPTDYVYMKPKREQMPITAEDQVVMDSIMSKYSFVKPAKTLTHEEITLVPIDQDVLFWYVQLIKKIQEKYSAEVKWYQNPMILGIVSFSLCIVLILVTFKYNAAAAAQMSQAAQGTAIEIINAAKSGVGQVIS